jgi:hypothetical protein
LTRILPARIGRAVDLSDKFEASTAEGGDLGVWIEKAEDQLDGFAPPFAMGDRLTGFMIGVANVEADQCMSPGLQYPGELTVRRIPILIVEMNDHVQAIAATDSVRIGSAVRSPVHAGTRRVRHAKAAIASERSTPTDRERSAR